jgi:ketosteroid isomerase-like protein
LEGGVNSEIEEIERCENERYRALLAKDCDALELLLHADFRMIHSNGVQDTKASYIDGVRARKWDYRRADQSEQSIRVFGQTGVVSNRLSISILVDGVPRELDVRVLSVWVRSDAATQLVAVQSAPVPPA